MSVVADFRTYKEYRARLDAIFAWAMSHLEDGSLIRVDLGPFLGQWYWVSGHGALRKILSVRQSAASVPTALHVCLAGRHEAWAPEETGWLPLFRSPVIEVWIRPTFGKEPFPWRASEDEKRALLRIARKSAEHFLSTGKSLPFAALIPGLSRLENGHISADIAYWVDGSLRGSIIIGRAPCAEAVGIAAIKALQDMRFKPLGPTELARAHIELTLWGDLLVPLMPSEIAQGDIYFDKLYMATDSAHKGWYLPETFNCARFASLRHFLDSLAQDKAHISHSEPSFYVAEVTDIIESADRIQSFSMTASVIERSFTEKPLAAIAFEVRAAGEAAASHVLGLQANDGWMPSIIDPSRYHNVYATSWPRLAFMAWALAQWGKATKSPDSLMAAERLLDYLAANAGELALSLEERATFAAYLGQAGRALSREALFEREHDALMRLVPNLPFEPIAHLQAAKLLGQSGDDAARQQGRELFEKTLHRFLLQRKRTEQPISLASYAELLTLTPELDDLHEPAIRAWYRAYQHEDGSFPNTTASHFSYSRGTGKLFEAMSAFPAFYEKEIVRSFGWLRQMQYNSENLYFVPEGGRAALVGGFRHDMGNTQAWIDAAGHFLIGCARLLASGVLE